MNKLFTKIAGLSLGLAMAIGVGVAVGSNRQEAKSVTAGAESVEFTYTDFGYTGNSYKSASATVSSIGFYCDNGATNSSKMSLKASASVYNTTALGEKITSIVFTGAAYSNSSSSGFFVYGGTSENPTSSNVTIKNDSGSTGTVTVDFGNNTCTYFTIKNKGSRRFDFTKVTVNYVSNGGGGGGGGDTITAADLAATNTSYTSFSGVTKSSGAVYLGKTAKDSSGNIQVNATTNNGIATSASGGTIKNVSVSWGSTPTSGRGFTIRASTTAYTASNLTTNGTTIGDLTSSVTSLNITGDYTFVSVSGKGGAVYAASISFTWEAAAAEPSLSIATASTSVTRDGTANQTIQFTATPSDFSDDLKDIAYEWRSSNTNAISVTSVGSESTADLKVVGAGSSTITCYALGLSGEEATSDGVTVTVTNETYSGSLSITTSGDILTGASGTLAYTLSGNTHPMNTIVATSSDSNVISFSGLDYTAGSTPGATATVTLTASSTIYTLETYQAQLSVTLIDSQSVSSVTTNIGTRNVKFGGSSLSFVATVHLVGGGDSTGKQVTWTPADSGVCTITPSADTLTGTVVPVNVGSTTVRVASVDNPNKYVDVTVNVSAPDTKTLNSITINKGEGYKQQYYDTATDVDLTGLSLTANYVNATYPTYSENVAVANDASGVTWTLDKTNELVKVSYIVSAVEVEDSFSITIVEEPSVASIASSDFGIANDTDASGSYIVAPFTFTFAQNSGTNAPKYYTNGASVRMYKSNTLVISCNESVESIDSIVITVHDNKLDFSISTNIGGSCSGSGLEYTFTDTTEITFTAGSGQFRPATFEISYTKVESQDKDVESVTVTPSSASVESGKTTNLSVEVLPVDARDLTVTWESDDESVATVDEHGVVTGVAPGTATITATSNDQDDISDSATITVTAGPVADFTTTAKIEDESGSQVYLGNAYFDLTVEGGTYRGGEARGAQFSSSKEAVDVDLKLTDIAVATQDLRVIVDASRNANGNATLEVKVGNTNLTCDSESSVTLTTTSAEYEFIYSGSSSSTVNLSNLIDVSLSNNGGAIFVKTIKVYSAASKSVVGDFCTESLRMESYDVGGTQGSTGGNDSCKTWWSGVLSSYNGLTDGQKALFSQLDTYSAARSRLSEWARINGYSFDSSTGVLSQGALVNVLQKTAKNAGTSIAIIAISAISLAAIGGYFFFQKKKEN